MRHRDPGPSTTSAVGASGRVRAGGDRALQRIARRPLSCGSAARARIGDHRCGSPTWSRSRPTTRPGRRATAWRRSSAIHEDERGALDGRGVRARQAGYASAAARGRPPRAPRRSHPVNVPARCRPRSTNAGSSRTSTTAAVMSSTDSGSNSRAASPQTSGSEAAFETAAGQPRHGLERRLAERARRAREDERRRGPVEAREPLPRDVAGRLDAGRQRCFLVTGAGQQQAELGRSSAAVRRRRRAARGSCAASDGRGRAGTARGARRLGGAAHWSRPRWITRPLGRDAAALHERLLVAGDGDHDPAAGKCPARRAARPRRRYASSAREKKRGRSSCCRSSTLVAAGGESTGGIITLSGKVDHRQAFEPQLPAHRRRGRIASIRRHAPGKRVARAVTPSPSRWPAVRCTSAADRGDRRDRAAPPTRASARVSARA